MYSLWGATSDERVPSTRTRRSDKQGLSYSLYIYIYIYIYIYMKTHTEERRARTFIRNMSKSDKKNVSKNQRRSRWHVEIFAHILNICGYLCAHLSNMSQIYFFDAIEISDFEIDRIVHRLFSRSFFVYRRFSDRATFRAREITLCQTKCLYGVS